MHSRSRRTRPTTAVLAVATAIVALLGGSGCDGSDPESDDAPFARIEVLFVPTDGERTTFEVSADPDFVSGAATVSHDTLVVQPEQEYEGRVVVYDANSRNVTSRIRAEPENYQFIYSVLRARDVTLTVTDLESSYGENLFGADLPVGIQFTLGVGPNVDATSGGIRVQFGVFRRGVKTGSTFDGAPMVDVELPVVARIPPEPIPNETITRARLTLERVDGTEKWVAEATNPFALNLGPTIVPTDLLVLRCVPGDMGAESCATPIHSDANRMTLLPGEYAGSWRLFDDENEELTQTIRDTGRRHVFRYSANFGPELFSISDADSAGSPVGLEFDLSIPTSIITQGGFTAELIHFDPNVGEPKEAGVSTSAPDMSYRMPMSVWQNWIPEPIDRFELALSRTDTDQVSRLVAFGREAGVFTGSLDSLRFETCTGTGAAQTCQRTDSLFLAAGTDYSGEIQLFDEDGGQRAMDEIVREATLHRFHFFGFFAMNWIPTDTDANGMPVGFALTLTTPTITAAGPLTIALSHYGRFGFKTDEPSVERDLNLTIPVSVTQ